MIRCLNCMKAYEDSYDVCPHCGFIKGTPPKEAYHLHPGMTLQERYIMGTVLGFGGFGVTYRAWDMKLETMIAIKEYYPNGIVNRIPGEKEVIVYSGNREKEFLDGKRRFLDEARNMARFSDHLNIVHVFNFFEENQTAYIAMEFLDGISYKQYIRDNGGRVAIDEAVSITVSILSALKAIHNQKIIHRDISPDNIFICQGGVIKLIDFGAARFSSGAEEKTLSIVLKPGYAPPEQYRNKSRQGPWTDIYAVGAVLYRAITGYMPDESVNRLVRDDVKEPKTLEPEIPDYINNAIMRAMAVDQELRFRDVDRFKAALLEKQNVRNVEEELKQRKKKRIGLGVILALVILASGLGCYSFFQAKAKAAGLKPATLTVWLPKTDTAENVFNAMTKEYREKNSQIVLDVTYIPEKDYKSRLETALKGGYAPMVFDSSVLEEEYNSYLASVGDILTDEEKKHYFFIDAETYFTEKKKIPLSFQLPVLYVNQLMTVGQKGTPLMAKDMKSEGAISFTVNPKVLKSYAMHLYDRNLSFLKRQPYIAQAEKKDMETLRQCAYDSFAEKETAYYFSDTSDYARIKNGMAGIYEIEVPEGETIYGSFSNVMSVKEGIGADEMKAARRLLYYMLSERAQDALAVQEKAGLPVNRNAYRTYLSLNTEFVVSEKAVEDYAFDETEQKEYYNMLVN